MTLDAPLSSLTGIGPRRAADLARIGLQTVGDLLARFPIRYEDRSHFRDIASLRAGETACISGTVVTCGLRLTRRPGFKLFKAVIRDGSGSIRVAWLNQPFMADVIHRGDMIVLFGEVRQAPTGGLQVTNPQHELVDDESDTIHTGRIVPVYEKAGSVTGRMQRRLVFDVNDFDETLPAPFEWDVKRLAASFAVAARDNGLRDHAGRAAAEQVGARPPQRALRRGLGNAFKPAPLARPDEGATMNPEGPRRLWASACPP